MKMLSAVNVRVPPGAKPHFNDVGTGEVRFAENELDISRYLPVDATLHLRTSSTMRLLTPGEDLPQESASTPGPQRMP